MNEFINALESFNIKTIIPAIDRITKHIYDGFLTQEDKFFIDYCLPLIECSNHRMKLLLKGEKNNGRIKKTT